MKLSNIKDSVKADFITILNFYDINTKEKFDNQDHGKGLKLLYALLNIVSRNRAYDDNHPFFQNGKWKRILPYDGRNYCFYYDDNTNDSHVETLLKSIKKELFS